MPRNKNRAREKRGPFFQISTVWVLIFSSTQDLSNKVNSLFSAKYQATIVDFRFRAVYKQRSESENNFLPTGTVGGL